MMQQLYVIKYLNRLLKSQLQIVFHSEGKNFSPALRIQYMKEEVENSRIWHYLISFYLSELLLVFKAVIKKNPRKR